MAEPVTTTTAHSLTSTTFSFGPRQEEDPPSAVREPRRPKPTGPSMSAEARPDPVLVSF